MITKKLLNTLYRKIKSELTDKEILTGKEYNNYISKMCDGVTEKYNAHTTVQVVADESEGAFAAYTDGNKVVINAFCDSYNTGDDLTKRHQSILGRALHECGHLIWTNFKLSKKGAESIIEKGVLYPAPDGGQKDFAEFLERLPSIKGMIANLWHDIYNCVEDGFIEKLLLKKYPGWGKYLKNNRDMTQRDFPTYAEQKEKGLDSICILINLVLAQAKFENIKEVSEENTEDDVMKMFLEVRPLINAAVDECSSYHRQQKVNELFVKIFEIIKKEIEDKMSDDPGKESGDSDSSSGDGDGSSDSSSSDSDSSDGSSADSSGDDEGSDADDKKETSKSDADNPKDDSDGDSKEPKKSSKEGSKPSEEEVLDAIKKAIEGASKAADDFSVDGTSHYNCDDKDPAADEESSTSMTDGEDEGEEASASEDKKESNEDPSGSMTLDRIRDDEAHNRAEEEAEKEIERDLRKTADEISRDKDIHKGIPSVVHRVNPENGESLYEKEHQELDILARRMMKNLIKEIKDRQLGDALDGCYFGNRLDQPNLYRRDKKLYIKDILPEDVPDLEISVLVDCSGSMHCGERMEMARKTAYVVWKFCQMLKIPVSVTGHTTSGDKVVLFSVADRNSVDGNDGKRIFSLYANGENRDGYALRYVIKELEKSSATDRILLVISDGEPSHYSSFKSYQDAQGKPDIQDAVASAKKNGIQVITAGIGSCASSINKIWTDGVSNKIAAAFLEISDLDRLPKSFVKIVKKQLAS